MAIALKGKVRCDAYETPERSKQCTNTATAIVLVASDRSIDYELPAGWVASDYGFGLTGGRFFCPEHKNS